MSKKKGARIVIFRHKGIIEQVICDCPVYDVLVIDDDLDGLDDDEIVKCEDRGETKDVYMFHASNEQDTERTRNIHKQFEDD